MPPPPIPALVSSMIRSALARAHRAASVAESMTPGLTTYIAVDPSRSPAAATLETLPGVLVDVRLGPRRGTAKLAATASLNTMVLILAEAGKRLRPPQPTPARGGPKLAAEPKPRASRAG